MMLTFKAVKPEAAVEQEVAAMAIRYDDENDVGMVQANVGQKLLKRNFFKSFPL